MLAKTKTKHLASLVARSFLASLLALSPTIAKAGRVVRAASSFLLLTKLETKNIEFTHEGNHQKAVFTSTNNRDLLAARKHKAAITINSSLSMLVELENKK
jgi:hypothetical protein